MHYIIDIDSRSPEVMQYEDSSIMTDFKTYGVNTVEELNNYDIDRVVFKTIKEADEFLFIFKGYMKKLKLTLYKKTCGERSSLLMKRRYLALMLMGVKTATVRGHNYHNLKKGDVTYFYDQFNFIKVKITGISKDDEIYIYDFILVN